MIEGENSSELSVGVITHDRSFLFVKLLKHLKVAVAYAHSQSENNTIGPCSLIVVNNSGAHSHNKVLKAVDESEIRTVCKNVDVIDSPVNNIAVGRNLVLDNTQCRWLVFVDDDEYPNPDWLSKLYQQQQISDSAVVAGPIEPVYPEGTPKWVAALDLHNKGNLKTGDRPARVATGNCILDMEKIGSHRFDPDFGLTGGSDALFFEQLADRGLYIVWREDAVVHETIPENRASSRYMVFRCMTQGQNFKRVILRKAGLFQHMSFRLKALLIAPPSLLIGALMLPIHDTSAALWLKRGFTNLGKLIKPSQRLYG